MKRISITIFIIIVIFALVSCKAETAPETKPDTFEIYLATTESIREFGYYDTENLKLSGVPVLTGDDIRHYYWEQHIIELNGTFMERLAGLDKTEYAEFSTDISGFRQYSMGGSKFLNSGQFMGFIIVVNGEKVYSGTFPSGTTLPSEEELLVLGDISDDMVALVYNGDAFDIRNNDSIYDYFNKAGKLGKMSDEDTDELVQELQNRLEASEKEKNELQVKYDELKAGEPTDSDLRDATIEWQKNRLLLYMRETQEGPEYEELSDSFLQLDLSKVESISEAADIFRRTAVASTQKNDRMFNVFEELYNVVLDGIPLYYSIDEIDNDFIKKAAENWIIISIDAGKVTAYPMIGMLSENFGVFLSPGLNEYLQILDHERSYAAASGSVEIVKEGKLTIGVGEVSELIYLWKKFTVDYPYSYPFNFKAMDRSEYLMDIYIGRAGLTESPLYDGETLELTEEAKESYEYFLAEYTDSPYYILISDYYGLLQENSFVYAQIVEEYVNSIDYSNYK